MQRMPSVKELSAVSGVTSAAYTEWLNREIQEALDDSQPNIPNDEVMGRMNVRIAHHKAKAAETKRAA